MNQVRRLAIGILLCSSIGLADETEWLITDPPASTSANVAANQEETALVKWTQPGSATRKVGSAMAVVLGLLFLFTVLTKRGGQGTKSDMLMSSLGSMQVTPGVRLHLVKIGSRILVLHIAGKSVQPVAEIDDPREVEHILGEAGHRVQTKQEICGDQDSRTEHNAHNVRTERDVRTEHDVRTELLDRRTLRSVEELLARGDPNALIGRTR